MCLVWPERENRESLSNRWLQLYMTLHTEASTIIPSPVDRVILVVGAPLSTTVLHLSVEQQSSFFS